MQLPFGMFGSQTPSTATQIGLILLHLLATPESRPPRPSKNLFLDSTGLSSTFGQTEQKSTIVAPRRISTRTSTVWNILCSGKLYRPNIALLLKTDPNSAPASHPSMVKLFPAATNHRTTNSATKKASTAPPSSSTTMWNTIDWFILFNVSNFLSYYNFYLKSNEFFCSLFFSTQKANFNSYCSLQALW